MRGLSIPFPSSAKGVGSKIIGKAVIFRESCYIYILLYLEKVMPQAIMLKAVSSLPKRLNMITPATKNNKFSLFHFRNKMMKTIKGLLLTFLFLNFKVILMSLLSNFSQVITDSDLMNM